MDKLQETIELVATLRQEIAEMKRKVESMDCKVESIDYKVSENSQDIKNLKDVAAISAGAIF